MPGKSRRKRNRDFRFRTVSAPRVKGGVRDESGGRNSEADRPREIPRRRRRSEGENGDPNGTLNGEEETKKQAEYLKNSAAVEKEAARKRRASGACGSGVSCIRKKTKRSA